MKPNERIFVTSDQHFGHSNIIQYCNRPFQNVREMDTTMLNSWNHMIKRQDSVYFLGDLTYGRGSKTTDDWLRQLNGRIRFIKGNHDESNHIPFVEASVLMVDHIPFLLIHDPSKVPDNWSGWVIHGHVHNNGYSEMIDFENKRVNVSVEMTGYKPVNIRAITGEIRKRGVI